MFSAMIARKSLGFACLAMAMLATGGAVLSGGGSGFPTPFSLLFAVIAFTCGLLGVIAFRR